MLLQQKHYLYLITQLVILLALGIWFYQQNQMVTLATPQNNRFECVSYAPYYQPGKSPLIPNIKVSRAQITSDLQTLAKITDCVRTYSVSQGLDYVPVAAKQAGLSVYLGAWIGWTDADNLKEIDLATKVANAYPNTVKGIIIGNEVLLRQEQTEAKLHDYLSRAKQQTKLPLTYADVWEFWLQHPKLESSVDFVTVHILPYWEDNPVNIRNGTQHAKAAMARLQQQFDKPILIGETGWPSAGRQRHGSKPSLLNQARYIREFVQTANIEGWHYNIIEAIDQPWKRALEGTVGAYWGLLSPTLTPKFAMQTPVAERQDGMLPILAAVIGAALCFGFSYIQASKPLAPVLALGNTFLGASIGLVSLLQWEYLTATYATWSSALPLASIVAVGWLGCFGLIKQADNHTSQRLSWLLLGLLFFAIISSYLLYHDGRYRDFPTILIALPAIVLTVARYTSKLAINAGWWRLIPISIAVVYAILIIKVEPDNQSAILWASVTLLLGLANWPNRLRSTK